MLITIIIFAMSLLLLVGYSFKGIAIAKKKLALDAKLYELLTVIVPVEKVPETETEDVVIETAVEENTEPETQVTDTVDAKELSEIYNEIADVDNEYAEYSSNVPKLAVITAVIGVIVVIAYFILETPV